MKKTLLFVPLFMAFIIGANAQIVTNGDFETGDFTGWQSLADNCVIQDAETMADPTHLIDGTYSCYKNWGPGDFVSQVITLDPGLEYTLSYETFFAESGIFINAYIYDTSNDQLIAEANAELQDANPPSVDFTAPASGSVEIVFNKSGGDLRVGIDNVVVELKTATSISNVKADDVKVAQTASGDFVVSGSVEISSLSVFASGGQLVKETAGNGASEVTFNLSGQSQGLYIIRIEDAQGNVSVKKVINN